MQNLQAEKRRDFKRTFAKTDDASAVEWAVGGVGEVQQPHRARCERDAGITTHGLLSKNNMSRKCVCNNFFRLIQGVLGGQLAFCGFPWLSFSAIFCLGGPLARLVEVFNFKYHQISVENNERDEGQYPNSTAWTECIYIPVFGYFELMTDP